MSENVSAEGYESAQQAIAVRTEACHLAVQTMGADALDEHGSARLMALCVFFESYIAHGSAWTETNMRLLSRRKVKNLRVIAGGKL